MGFWVSGRQRLSCRGQVDAHPVVCTEQNILFLTYLVAPQGLAAVYRAFPKIRIIGAALGNDIREWTFTIPKQAPGAKVNGIQSIKEGDEEDDLESGNKLQSAFRRLQFNRRNSDSEQTVKRAYIVVPGR